MTYPLLSRQLRFWILFCAAPLAWGQAADTLRKNGFDLAQAMVPPSEIQSGGPGRDGIPALLNPQFVPVSEVDYLQSEDMVVGVQVGGVFRAYPLRILTWHEVVNDQIGPVPLVVTYCPLCGNAMVFSRNVGERTLTFGVSGLLYRSNVLMYDHQTESLWSQLAMQAIAGPLMTNQLTLLASQRMNWQAWKLKHPAGTVLSPDTGHERDYQSAPYAGYAQTDQLMFAVPQPRRDLPNKQPVLGLVLEGQPVAYRLDRISLGDVVFDTIGRRRLQLSYYAPGRHIAVTDAVTGRPIPAVEVYWFAWQAFYPQTRLVTPGPSH